MINITCITGANLLKCDTVFKICFYDKKRKEFNNVLRAKSVKFRITLKVLFKIFEINFV